MKYWLSHLPLEVWVDCYRYPGITREQMGQIVDLIGNHKYGEYLQFYLHDWGKRTLGPIHFIQQKHPNASVDYQRPSKAIPLTPMPNNIRAFQLIQINHFDHQTIAFLHQIQPLLLADIKLYINGIEPSKLETLRAILDHLLPLLGGEIDSLKCNLRELPTVGQCFGEKLAKINMLKLFYEGEPGMDEAMTRATINFLMTWLTQPAQQDGNNIVGPKWCDMTLWNDCGLTERICAAIREDFLAAKSPRSFVVSVLPFYPLWVIIHFAEFHLQNGIGEQLHGVKIGQGWIQITRHRADCGTEMEEWIQEIKAKRSNGHSQNQISIQSPTIGQIDAMDVPEDVEEIEEKPSTSKQA